MCNNEWIWKWKWRRMKPDEYIELTRYNHLMEFVLDFMRDKEWKLSDYTLQDFWNLIQKQRDLKWWGKVEI